MKLVSLDISADMMSFGVILGIVNKRKNMELKQEALERMDITRDPGDSPLEAYMKHIHAINDVPYEVPANPDITNAILLDGNAMRTIFFLA